MGRDRASRPEAPPLRLFVAVDIPDDVRLAVADAIAPLRDRLAEGRWTPPSNWHVTLKFLGRTWPRLVPSVFEAVERVAGDGRRFRTSVRGIGAFPSERRARVLWAGVDDPDDAMRRLADALDDDLAADFKREARAFTPHLTVARLDPPRPVGEELASLETRAFGVEELVVYRSHLRRPAPVYEPIARFPLGNAAEG